VVFTEGAKYVAEAGGAYWLLDEIALIQPYDKAVGAEPFQVSTLKVNKDDRSAVLICADGDGKQVYEKRIPYTDFPLDEIIFFFADNTIYLPGEHCPKSGHQRRPPAWKSHANYSPAIFI
jgi:hypothetical protein